LRVDLSVLAWRSASELVEALARQAGLEIQTAAAGPGADVEHVCSLLGLEAERVELVGRAMREQLRQSVPSVVPLAGLHLGLVACRGNTAVILTPDLSLRSVAIETLRDMLCDRAEASHTARVDKLLEHCAIPAGRRPRVRRALLEEQIGSQRLGMLWQLRVRPGSSFTRQARDAGLGSRLLLLCSAHMGEYALWLLAWWALGLSALNGRADRGLLIAWLLLLLTIVPLRMLATRSMGALGLALGGLLKQRLLAGALRLESEQIRSQGAGQLLGRVIESETVESLALSGGLTAVMAAFELVFSAVVLALGKGGVVQILLLAGWVVVTGFLGWRYARRRAGWTESRVQMTNDLVENMAGHRTRIVQSSPDRWHANEDEALDRYVAASALLDRENARLAVLAPQGWLIIGLAGLAPAFLSSGPADLAKTAVGVGGVLLAHQALRRLSAGLASLAGAAISWKQVAALFHAAERAEPVGTASASTSRDVIRVQDIQFRYHQGGEPVLHGASFQISKGDWILLEGSSGGGKSTLASLLAGSREPETGILLAGGLDRRTLGASEWRRHVAMAPQYHENHILTESLAFNLLMGRRWPPGEKDWVEAESVCRELGLGELLERMPAGLQQVVGETGWQLSQGERSRVFMARALLQGSGLVILDESFAALDPENLRQCLECVLKRSQTLMVVAHP